MKTKNHHVRQEIKMSNDTTILSEPQIEKNTLNSTGRISVCIDDINYTFDIINVAEVSSGIIIPDSKHYSGWIILRQNGVSVLAFDLRENYTSTGPSYGSVIKTEVLRDNTIMPTVFIVENEMSFVNRLRRAD
jgi:hypothetical protein